MIAAYMPHSGTYHWVPDAEFHPGVMGTSLGLCRAKLCGAEALATIPAVYRVCRECDQAKNEAHQPKEFRTIVRPTEKDPIFVLHAMCICDDEQCSYSITVDAYDVRWNRT